MNASPVYDNSYIKTAKRTYEDKVYCIFHGLNALNDGVECESFVIKYYLQVYLDNCAYEIVKKKKKG